MIQYILFIQKNRKLLLVAMLVIILLAAIGLTRIEINSDFNIFQLSNSEAQEVLMEMERLYGDSDQTLLLYKIEGDLTDAVGHVSEALSELSIAHLSPLRLKQLTENYGIDDLSPIITMNNDTYALFTINLEAGFDMNLLYDALDGKYYLSGNTYMQNEVLTLIGSILTRIPPLAMLLVLLTFRSQLHSFKAAILSILPAGLAAFLTLGIAGWIGGELSIITVLAPIFTIVIGSADGLHFISHMEDQTEDRVTALSHTLKLIGMPMIITTTTSIAGFVSLVLIDTDAIRLLAFYASLGILLAGIITWYVLPLILSGDMKLKPSKSKDRKSVFHLLWGLPSFLLTGLLLLTSIFAFNINREFNQLMFFESDTAVQENFEAISQINNGAIPVYYMDTFTNNSIETINQAMNKLKESPYVARIIQPFDYPEALETLLARQFIRYDNHQAYYRGIIYPSDSSNETLGKIVNEVKKVGLEGNIAGVQVLMKELNDTVITSQLISILATLLLILIMLRLTLKSWKLTLIASIPVIITSITLYGFLGITGISLNLMTATIFSISLGIGIDYAIHYTSVYKYYLDHQENEPLKAALKYTERPIIANAFGLALGMTALRLSPLTIHNDISSLMWFAMMTSVILSLTLIPTLLSSKTKKERNT